MEMQTTAEMAPPYVPISDLLDRVADECNELAGTADRLHSLAAMVVAQSTSVEVITNLQAIDRLTQYLAAFAKLFSSAARCSDSSWTVEIAPLMAELTLGELVDRLTGVIREEAGDDLDMF